MEAIYVVKKPVVTEKSTAGMEQGIYTFEVDPRSSKDDVRRAVETLYGVKVSSVRTQVRKGKLRRLRYGYSQESVVKTARVRLADGATIELF